MEKKETLSEEVKEFDPSAFAGLDKLVDRVGSVDEEVNEEPSSLMEDDSVVEESVIDSVLEPNEEEDESDFDWSSEMEEESSEEGEGVEDTISDDWDSPEAEEPKEDDEAPQELDWASVADALGMEASSKEEILEAIKSKSEPKVSNDTTSKYEGFLKLSDRELLAADMKATGMDEYDVDDSLDRMEDSGMLKHEALKIRKQLTSAIKGERKSVKEKSESEASATVKGQEDARKALQDHLKGFNNYLGGKVTVEQRKDLYKYITNGSFNEDVYKSHANVAEAAFLWKNRSQIQKMLQSQGFESGKGSVLDNLTNRGGRGNSKPKYKTGEGFNAAAFMDE